ncbi:pseudouridylate synthase 7 homolog [Limulus polyphemus]|uniref:Pseudouridylate synthase 7 homolog n=1 Tax=Limulus polyphemus TaxID=6850 RepID=A0ABM1BRL0_LIMPO|nr:pseudouridylate synthase 7 homolog [Limulus polyphemus]
MAAATFSTNATPPVKETDFEDQECEPVLKKAKVDSHTPSSTTITSRQARKNSETEGDLATGENIGDDDISISLSEDITENNDVSELQTEKDVGIEEFVSDKPGFFGIIKQRYSDFLVNEKTTSGTTVKLSQLELPVDVSISETGVSIPEAITDVEESKLRALESNTKEDDCFEINVTNFSKDERRKIHEYIRKNYTGLNSQTEDRGEEKVISVCRFSKNNKRGNRNYWPSGRGDYTNFVLYKENRDTMDAINNVAAMLKMKTSAFSYAGTKDKRGKTSQQVSVYRVPGEKLLNLNGKLRGITIGNIQYKQKSIKLGDLSGNNFVIILRNITGSDTEVEQAVESLHSKGFVNYYGMQRFGTTTVPTQDIGRALVQGDYKGAIELILKPRGIEDANLAACRKLWWETRDASKAIRQLQRKSTIEGHLLQGLVAHGPNDLVNALNFIPRNTRLMYIHSYQSFIWNKVVTRRIKQFGLVPIIGDLLLPGNDPEKDVCKDGISKCSPSVVTEADLSKGISIYDIVLPLPGYNIVYPQNEVMEWYKELLEKDNLTLTSFQSRVKSYSLGGSYRHLLVRPQLMSWAILRYDDIKEPLVLSDLDVVQGVQLPSVLTSGKLKALKLEFSLPSSSYATMAIREILKMDTSAWMQKSVSLS